SLRIVENNSHCWNPAAHSSLGSQLQLHVCYPHHPEIPFFERAEHRAAVAASVCTQRTSLQCQDLKNPSLSSDTSFRQVQENVALRYSMPPAPPPDTSLFYPIQLAAAFCISLPTHTGSLPSLFPLQLNLHEVSLGLLSSFPLVVYPSI